MDKLVIKAIKEKKKEGTIRPTLFLRSLMLFGKYRFKRVTTLIDTDLEYMKWFITVYDGEISEEVKNKIKDR